MGRLRLRTKDLPDDAVHCTAVALIFGQPTEPTMERAAQQVDYFDVRTGESWDLFFPGYYRYGSRSYDPGGEELTDDPIGPWFSARDFNAFRHEVETRSGRKWEYSGNVDLVLINAFLFAGGEPVIDWESTAARELVDANGSYREISLGGVIEAVSRGIEHEYESQDWNLPPANVVRKEPSAISGVAREALAGVLAGLILGLR
jgi:hypothetical protein